uniref:RanBP2-type domain-containing protein n=1 Tax=Zosterops lateralis melanops TaxID=1220523 RepID=A0A8D2PB22_ZOSLA
MSPIPSQSLPRMSPGRWDVPRQMGCPQSPPRPSQSPPSPSECPCPQVFRELGFPALAQRWIIGQSLCRDGRSLSSYGIRGDGDTAFLFLLTATAAGLGRQQQAQSLLRAAGLGDLWDSAGAPPMAPEPRPPSPDQGWPCPRCTFLNKPTRPGCEMCSSPRPEGYRVPGGHRPDPAEQQRLQREQDGTRQCQQVWKPIPIVRTHPHSRDPSLLPFPFSGSILAPGIPPCPRSHSYSQDLILFP